MCVVMLERAGGELMRWCEEEVERGGKGSAEEAGTGTGGGIKKNPPRHQRSVA